MSIVRDDLARSLPALRDVLSRYCGTSWPLIVSASALAVAASVTGVAASYAFSHAIDMGGGNGVNALLLGLLLFAVLVGANLTLQSAVQYVAMWSSQKLYVIAATAFFDRVLRKTPAFFIAHNPTEIQTAQARGQQAINTLFQRFLVVFGPGLFQVGLSLLALGAVVDFTIAAVVLAYGLFLIGLTYQINVSIKPYMAAATQSSQEASRFIGNYLNSVETLRYFGASPWLSASFESKVQSISDGWSKVAKRRLICTVAFGAALAAQLALTFAILIPSYAAGEVTIGEIVFFATLVGQLNIPFTLIGSAIDDTVRSFVDLRPFVQIWNAEEETQESGHALPPGSGELRFERVSFGYGDKTTIYNATMTAERGGITFLVGDTGAGKSTLMKLALKAVSPSEGRIYFNDTDLSLISRGSWYTTIGMVPQEILLLNDTIAANIALWRPVDPAPLHSAARMSGGLAFVTGLPNGFNTAVGERGLRLSGGERQRLAIARALYASPQLLLLDEASSALDESTEAEIVKELRLLADTVTIVAITHRMNVIGADDVAFRVEAGELTQVYPEDLARSRSKPSQDGISVGKP